MKKIKIADSTPAFLFGISVIIILITAAAKNPFEALSEFFIKPFSSLWYFGNMLNKTSLFLFAGCGALFAFKCGCFNLGGEGQIYFAGFLTSLLLQNKWQCAPLVQFTVSMSIVFAASFFIGIIYRILKNKLSINELLTSFLLSSTLLPVLNYLISGPFRGAQGNLLATPSIANEFKLKLFLPPSSLNASAVFAIIIVVFFIFFFSKTKYGYRLNVSGKAPEFARFAGFSQTAPGLAGMGISSGLHGLTGFFSITGTWYVCHLEFSSGMGWAALAIALIAKQNFAAIIPAAFLYSWIQSASDAAVMAGSLLFDTAIFLQAAVFLFISANFFGFGFYKRFLAFKIRKIK